MNIKNVTNVKIGHPQKFQPARNCTHTVYILYLLFLHELAICEIFNTINQKFTPF